MLLFLITALSANASIKYNSKWSFRKYVSASVYMKKTVVRNIWNTNHLIMMLFGDLSYINNKEPYKYEFSDYSNEEIWNIMHQMKLHTGE